MHHRGLNAVGASGVTSSSGQRRRRLIAPIVVLASVAMVSFWLGIVLGSHHVCTSTPGPTGLTLPEASGTIRPESIIALKDVATALVTNPPQRTVIASTGFANRVIASIEFPDEHLLPYLPNRNRTIKEIEHFLSLRRRVTLPDASSRLHNETYHDEHDASHGESAMLMLIPVNEGYVDFGLNLFCSLVNVSSGRDHSSGPIGPVDVASGAFEGFTFVAMDEPAYIQLSQMGLPVYHDPDVPFVTSKSAAWADPKFHSLVCTKLFPVLRSLRLGHRVILSDADIVFLQNPVPYYRWDVGVTFSIGSCHKDLRDNFQFLPEGIEKLNTGFYAAQPTPQIIAMISKALEVCRSSSLVGDQPAINSVIQGDWSSGSLRKQQGGDGDANNGAVGSQSAYSYAFFDGCLFANGCVFFKHLCANTSSYPVHMRRHLSPELLHVPRNGSPVMVHANFLVGKKDKIKHLKKYNLWDTECIQHFRERRVR